MVVDRFQVQQIAVENFGNNAVDDTIGLPDAHPVSAIILEWILEDSAANVNSSIDAFDVEIAGESLFSRMPGDVLRDLIEWNRGRVEGAPGAGLTEVHRLRIPFDRAPMDSWMLPAHEFNAALSFQGSLDTADTQNTLRVSVEQALGKLPDQIVTPKFSNPDDVSVDAGEDWRLEARRGRRLAALYLEAGNTDVLDGQRLTAHVNNRQETIYDVFRAPYQVHMLHERNIRDDALPGTFVAFPVDRQRAYQQAVPTGKQGRVNDVIVEGAATSGAATASIDLWQEDYVALG